MKGDAISLADVKRRKVLAFGLASLPACFSGCGGGGGAGSSSGGGSALAITSVSSATPTALTPLALQTSGLDPDQAFTVTLSNPSGYDNTLNPIRSASDGTVVVAVPLYLDPSTGSTAALTASVQISQGAATSNAVSLSIADIPASASYGVSPGAISRAFLLSQAIYLGITENALQAMGALATSSTDTTTVQEHLLQQQAGAIEASDNIDLIGSGARASLSIGTAGDGTAIVFNAASVDIMDRIVAMYLQSIGYLPSAIYGPAALAGRGRARWPARAQATVGQIVAGMSTAAGAIDLASAAVQAAAVANPSDTLVALGWGVASALFLGAPSPAAGAQAAGLALSAGAIYAVAALVDDGYKWTMASNALDSALNAGNPAALAAAQRRLSSAQASFGASALAATLGAFASSSPAAVGSSPGAQVLAALNAFEATGASGTRVSVQGATLLAGIAGIVAGGNGRSAAATDASIMSASNREVPAGATSFGFVDGSVAISANFSSPLLAPLTAMQLTDPNTGTAFSTLAGTDQAYEMIVPVGVPAFDYAQMSMVPYDPISLSELNSPTTVDLAAFSATNPITLPTETGSCTDTDATDPDGNDPDCG